MASSLPSPGQLVFENISLLSPSPSAFQQRYGHVLTPHTFAKPGNTQEANAVLHFLLCQIDPALTQLFKPCFPIRDREQERDFRRIVDARLAVLDKSKLLPVGVARKNVVSTAGGDRFLDLLWSLSVLALQQACLRHPPYGPISRLSPTPQAPRPDALSHQPSARSNRSLLSVVSSRSDRDRTPHDPAPARQRRFLGVGMISQAQHRSRDAELIRARIDAERHALNRTTNLANRGATTWASEAQSLRGKIDRFEAKIARLKGQLSDMGFDENGVDIRSSSTHLPPSQTAHSSADQTPISVDLRTSPSRDSIADDLKTSPIDSTESGSSVDEIPEPSEAVADIVNDLSHLLSFTAETREMRERIDRSLSIDKPHVSFGSPATPSEAANVVDLIRAATTELEEATNRMDEIQEERRRARQSMSLPDDGPNTTANAKHSLADQHALRKSDSGDVDTSISMISVVEDTDVKEEAQREAPMDTALTSVESVSSSPMDEQPQNKLETTQPPPPSTDPYNTEVALHEDDASPDIISAKPERKVSLVAPDEEISEQLPPPDTVRNDISSAEQVNSTHSEAEASLKQQMEVVERSEKLRKDVDAFSDLVDGFVEHDEVPAQGDLADPEHVNSAHRSLGDMKEAAPLLASKNGAESAALEVNAQAAKDLQAASKVVRSAPFVDRKDREDAMSRRRKSYATRSLDSINLGSDRTVELSPRYDTDVVVNPHFAASASKRSVRFAELPPSYSRTRGGRTLRPGLMQERIGRCATEVHPRSPRAAQKGMRADSLEGGNSMDKKRVDVSVNLDGAVVGASGQKPPRLQRRQTPHRIGRQKDIPPRSVSTALLASHLRTSRPSSYPASAAESSQNTEPFESETTRDYAVEEEKTNGEVNTDRNAERSEAIKPEDVVEDTPAVELKAAKEEDGDTVEQEKSKASVEEAKDDEKVSDLEDVCNSSTAITSSNVSSVTAEEQGVVSDEKESVARFDGGKTDFGRGSSDNLQGMMNHGNVTLQRGGGRSMSKVFGKKGGLLRISSVSMLGSMGSGKGRSLSMSSRDSQETATREASPKKASVESGEVAHSSPACRMSGGFFAGETAQYHENARLVSSGDSKVAGISETSTRQSTEMSSRSARGTGRASTGGSVGGRSSTGSGGGGSGRKNRMQSFRARWAALK